MSEMLGHLEHLIPLASKNSLAWSFAIIFLLFLILFYRMRRAKPELVLLGVAFIVVVVIGTMALTLGPSSGCSNTVIRTGDIDQSGSQNAAGVAGAVTQNSQPNKTSQN